MGRTAGIARTRRGFTYSHYFIPIALSAACVLPGGSAFGAEPDPKPDAARLEFFEARIRPVLVAKCQGCHSAEAKTDGDLEAGLYLDHRDGLLRGGESGPVLVPGKPGESLLMKALEYGGEISGMPPEGKLPAETIADFRRWIAEGAVDPRTDKPALAAAGKGDAHETSFDEAFRERATWWSLQPVRPQVPPRPDDANANEHPIDRFLTAARRREGVEAAPPADRETLLRRVTFVLTGLPPTATERAEFLADESPQAYEKVVDRLLASPRFGEHWAAYWLDVLRYAETHGSEGDPPLPDAWRFRDYLIRAFRDDLPYDRLVQELLAGDLLPPRLDATGNVVESRLGPGHFRMTEYGYQPVDSLDELAKTTDNRIEVITKAFLGLTVSCARCHDHKFDAIRQRDYYALYGILAGCRPGQTTFEGPGRSGEILKEIAGAEAGLHDRLTAAWLEDAALLPARLRNPSPASAAAKAEVAATRERLQAARAALAELDRRTRAKLLAARGKDVPNDVPLPLPLAAWSFERPDEPGGELLGGAKVERGRLVLDGKTAYLKAAPPAVELRERTLEVWALPAGLDQRGGGLLTLETEAGRIFDGIVYGERQPGRWISGSDHFRRTRDVDGPAETVKTAPAGTAIHLAIVYSADGTIALFRDGIPYGKPYRTDVDRPLAYPAGATRVLLGLRHTGAGKGFWAGEIDEARLYDRALSAAELHASFRAGPQGISAADLAAATEDRPGRERLLQEVATQEKALAAAEERAQAADPWSKALRESASDPASPLHLWAKFRVAAPEAYRAGRAAWLEHWRTELASRKEFNRKHFRPLWNLADPRDFAAWFKAGNGLGTVPTPAGGFVPVPSGDVLLSGLRPAGVWADTTLTRNPGAVLTSPNFRLPAEALFVRFAAGGGGGVRLVVDQYPLGVNGTYPQDHRDRLRPTWVRLDTSYRKGSEAYVEFASPHDLTRPDGKTRPYDAPVPTEERSWWGALAVWAGDGHELPRDESFPAAALLEEPAPQTADELPEFTARRLTQAITRLRTQAATEADVALVDDFVRRGLLRTRISEVPAAAEFAARKRSLEASLPSPERAPGVWEAAGVDVPLFLRGNHKTPGPIVPRADLSAFGGTRIDATGSGRLELAHAWTRPTHPLTYRTVANRLWYRVFGRGIVATIDNFGKLGDLPTHPELLDWLAGRFVEDGRSIKTHLRLLVTSRAFALSAVPTESARRLDPGNRLFSHATVRRLDAEALRDAYLAAAGELDPKPFGPSVHNGALNFGRRSIYIAVVRNRPHPFLSVFDKPNPLTSRGQRDVTTLPAQSLALMNSPFITELTDRWAKKTAAASGTVPERITAAFVSLLGREPTPDELASAVQYLSESAPAPDRDPAAWRDLLHALCCMKEAYYVR